MTTSSQENDWAVWMRAAMTGDEGAYRQLLVSLTPHVRAVARSRCRRLGAPEGEVEDLVQEVLLTMHLKRGTWDQSRPIGPWVAAIARNKLIDDGQLIPAAAQRAHFSTDDLVSGPPLTPILDELRSER